MEKRKQHSARVRERRLRARYKRNLKIAIVLSLLIGLAAGFAAGRLTAPAQEIDAPATADLPRHRAEHAGRRGNGAADRRADAGPRPVHRRTHAGTCR